jgi:flagellar basal-body rod protein FlgF
MDNAGYVALSRQSGLLMELDVIANNVANMNTVGFRREGVIFSEFVDSLPVTGGAVVSARPGARYSDVIQGNLTPTGGALDLAVDGQGYFMVESEGGGVNLTRAGAFTTNAESELVTWQGARVLDEGEAPIFIPPDARQIVVSTDGVISADGQTLTRIGVAEVEGDRVKRLGGSLYEPEGEVIPSETAKVSQGYLEQSNVNAVIELSRLVEVHRAYEIGQTLMNNEDQRIRDTVETVGQSA